MRIPVPTRVDPKLGTIFITVLFLAELLAGTDIIFAALVALFMAIFFAGFNLCKGLSYPSGAWIAFFGLGIAFLGLVGKAFLFEPAETHLKEPITTMSIYCVGMATASLGAYFGHRLAPKRAMLEDFVAGETMHRAAIGCLIVGSIITIRLFSNDTAADGSILAIIKQLNQFLRVALILGTFYVVQRSHGQKLYDWVVIGAGGMLFLQGLLGYSKEGLFFPGVAWFLSALVAGGNFSRKTIGLILVVTFFSLHYLVPFSQYGRKSRGNEGSLTQKFSTVFDYLLDLEGTRKLYLATADETSDSFESQPHFFDRQEGLLDREQMLAFDDSLITYTDEGNVYGLSPIYIGLVNVIPHFLWPNKPSFAGGNLYARQLGVIDSDDETTGISFSPVGDAYHEGKWLAVLFVLPGVVMLYSFSADSIVGAVKKSPWALLPIAVSANVAPQGLLIGTIYMATLTMVAILIVALASRFIFPLAVSLVMGEVKRRTQRPRLDFTPARRRTALLEGLSGEPGAGPGTGPL